jgi:hypothetical protein
LIWRLVLVLVVACSSKAEIERLPPPAPQPAPLPAPVPAPPPVDDEAPRTKLAQQEIDATLRERERTLGAKLITCEGTAHIMAGPAGGGALSFETREKQIFTMCTRDRWPMRVIECAATALDVLGCSAYLETPKQRKAWDAYFERLAGEP